MEMVYRYRKLSGAHNEKKKEKSLEFSFLVSHIVLRPFKGNLCELSLVDLFSMR